MKREIPSDQQLPEMSQDTISLKEVIINIENNELEPMIEDIMLKFPQLAQDTFNQLDNESMAKAIENDTNQISENSPAAMFLRKLRAVTGSIATSVQATKNARQNMFSMIARFGSPAIFRV